MEMCKIHPEDYTGMLADHKFDVTSLSNRKLTRINRLCVGDIIERVSWSFPDRECLVGVGPDICANEGYKRLTYRVANEKANQFANALMSRGVKKEDRVMIYCLNSIEHFLVQEAIAKIGCVTVGVNTMLQPHAVDHIITQTEPKFLIVDAGLYEQAATVFKKHGLAVGVTIPIGGNAVEGSQTFDEFIKGQPLTEPRVDDIQPTDVCQIMYTSGTETLPKGVMHSHLYLYFACLAYNMSYGRGTPTEMDVIGGIYFPIFHIAAQTMNLANMIGGGKSIMSRSPNDIGLIAESITQERITHVYAAPPHFYALADLVEKNPDKYDITCVKTIGYGWGSFRPDYAEKLKKLIGEDVLLIGIDGETESMTDNRYWQHLWYDTFKKTEPVVNHFGVSHPLYANTVMKIDQAVVAATNENGEKVMRGPCVMEGYYRDENATRGVFQDGWLRSRDAGYLDEEGVIVFTDRLKDMIKSGGENVVSRRIEDYLNLHPKIKDSAIVGLPHHKWTEAVTAFVVAEDGETITEAELLAYCKNGGVLAKFEIPKKFVFIDEIPLSVGTKRRKYILRQQYRDLYEGEK